MNIPFIPQVVATDKLGNLFSVVSKGILVVAVGFLPILCVPGVLEITTIAKTYLLLLAVLMSVIIGSLGVLRKGAVTLRFPILLLAWWGVVLGAVIAGLMAPQITTAFLGDALNVHTVGFLVLSGLLMTLMLTFQTVRSAVVYLYGCLFISAFVLSLWHLLRVFLGTDILSFGVLTSPVATLIGGFNDLALFLALVVQFMCSL